MSHSQTIFKYLSKRPEGALTREVAKDTGINITRSTNLLFWMVTMGYLTKVRDKRESGTGGRRYRYHAVKMPPGSGNYEHKHAMPVRKLVGENGKPTVTRVFVSGHERLASLKVPLAYAKIRSRIALMPLVRIE